MSRPCGHCLGSGSVPVNVTRDAITGVYEYREGDCTPCKGTGTVPPPSISPDIHKDSGGNSR